MESPLTDLSKWQNFYVIVGSSAGALTGLQFVVITLIAQVRITGSMREIRAFGTPTTVHFCMALLISAIASCPWRAISGLALILGLVGLGGVLYVLSAIRHAHHQTGYQPDMEDWLWYAGLPLATYVALTASGVLLVTRAEPGLYLVAATSLALLFLGIHNSWDTVTYIAVQHSRKARAEGEK